MDYFWRKKCYRHFVLLWQTERYLLGLEGEVPAPNKHQWSSHASSYSQEIQDMGTKCREFSGTIYDPGKKENGKKKFRTE